MSYLSKKAKNVLSSNCAGKICKQTRSDLTEKLQIDIFDMQ